MEQTMNTPGSNVSHSIITPECRANRGIEEAWYEAVMRAKREYDSIMDGWAGHDRQPTLHLILSIERPYVEKGAALVREDSPGMDAFGHALTDPSPSRAESADQPRAFGPDYS